eukprot:gene7037-9609_t
MSLAIPRTRSNSSPTESKWRLDEDTEHAYKGSEFARTIAALALGKYETIEKKKEKPLPVKKIFWDEVRYNPPLGNTHICNEHDAHEIEQLKYWKRLGTKFNFDQRLATHITETGLRGPKKPQEFPHSLEAPVQVFERKRVVYPFDVAKQYQKPVERIVPSKKEISLTPGPGRYSLPDLWSEYSHKKNKSHSSNKRSQSPNLHQRNNSSAFSSQAPRLSDWMFNSSSNPPSLYDTKSQTYKQSPPPPEERTGNYSPNSKTRGSLKSVLDSEFPSVQIDFHSFTNNERYPSPNQGSPPRVVSASATHQRLQASLIKPINTNKIDIQFDSSNNSLDEYYYYNNNKIGNNPSKTPGFSFPKGDTTKSSMFSQGGGTESSHQFRRVKMPDGTSFILMIDPSNSRATLEVMPKGSILSDSWKPKDLSEQELLQQFKSRNIAVSRGIASVNNVEFDNDNSLDHLNNGSASEDLDNQSHFSDSEKSFVMENSHNRGSTNGFSDHSYRYKLDNSSGVSENNSLIYQVHNYSNVNSSRNSNISSIPSPNKTQLKPLNSSSALGSKSSSNPGSLLHQKSTKNLRRIKFKKQNNSNENNHHHYNPTNSSPALSGSLGAHYHKLKKALEKDRIRPVSVKQAREMIVSAVEAAAAEQEQASVNSKESIYSQNHSGSIGSIKGGPRSPKDLLGLKSVSTLTYRELRSAALKSESILRSP